LPPVADISSGENATLSTESYAAELADFLTVTISHSRAIRSAQPVAASVPSGENTTLAT
jgi:hypothetical protein